LEKYWNHDVVKKIRVGTQSPRDHKSIFNSNGSMGWYSSNRIEFVENFVKPGDRATYKISMQAPSDLGDYSENFGLVYNGHRWFDECPIVSVSISVLAKDTH
jgi:hypothetical protein